MTSGLTPLLQNQKTTNCISQSMSDQITLSNNQCLYVDPINFQAKSIEILEILGFIARNKATYECLTSVDAQIQIDHNSCTRSYCLIPDTTDPLIQSCKAIDGSVYLGKTTLLSDCIGQVAIFQDFICVTRYEYDFLSRVQYYPLYCTSTNQCLLAPSVPGFVGNTYPDSTCILEDEFKGQGAFSCISGYCIDTKDLQCKQLSSTFIGKEKETHRCLDIITKQYTNIGVEECVENRCSLKTPTGFTCVPLFASLQSYQYADGVFYKLVGRLLSDHSCIDEDSEIKLSISPSPLVESIEFCIQGFCIFQNQLKNSEQCMRMDTFNMDIARIQTKRGECAGDVNDPIANQAVQWCGPDSCKIKQVIGTNPEVIVCLRVLNKEYRGVDSQGFCQTDSQFYNCLIGYCLTSSNDCAQLSRSQGYYGVLFYFNTCSSESQKATICVNDNNVCFDKQTQTCELLSTSVTMRIGKNLQGECADSQVIYCVDDKVHPVCLDNGNHVCVKLNEQIPSTDNYQGREQTQGICLQNLQKGAIYCSINSCLFESQCFRLSTIRSDTSGYSQIFVGRQTESQLCIQENISTAEMCIPNFCINDKRCVTMSLLYPGIEQITGKCLGKSEQGSFGVDYCIKDAFCQQEMIVQNVSFNVCEQIAALYNRVGLSDTGACLDAGEPGAVLCTDPGYCLDRVVKTCQKFTATTFYIGKERLSTYCLIEGEFSPRDILNCCQNFCCIKNKACYLLNASKTGMQALQLATLQCIPANQSPATRCADGKVCLDIQEKQCYILDSLNPLAMGMQEPTKQCLRINQETKSIITQCADPINMCVYFTTGLGTYKCIKTSDPDYSNVWGINRSKQSCVLALQDTLKADFCVNKNFCLYNGRCLPIGNRQIISTSTGSSTDHPCPCQDDYFQNDKRVCQQCHFSCLTCKYGGNFSCTSCIPGKNRVMTIQGEYSFCLCQQWFHQAPGNTGQCIQYSNYEIVQLDQWVYDLLFYYVLGSFLFHGVPLAILCYQKNYSGIMTIFQIIQKFYFFQFISVKHSTSMHQLFANLEKLVPSNFLQTFLLPVEEYQVIGEQDQPFKYNFGTSRIQNSFYQYTGGLIFEVYAILGINILMAFYSLVQKVKLDQFQQRFLFMNGFIFAQILDLTYRILIFFSILFTFKGPESNLVSSISVFISMILIFGLLILGVNNYQQKSKYPSITQQIQDDSPREQRYFCCLGLRDFFYQLHRIFICYRTSRMTFYNTFIYDFQTNVEKFKHWIQQLFVYESNLNSLIISMVVVNFVEDYRYQIIVLDIYEISTVGFLIFAQPFQNPVRQTKSLFQKFYWLCISAAFWAYGEFADQFISSLKEKNQQEASYLTNTENEYLKNMDSITVYFILPLIFLIIANQMCFSIYIGQTEKLQFIDFFEEYTGQKLNENSLNPNVIDNISTEYLRNNFFANTNTSNISLQNFVLELKNYASGLQKPETQTNNYLFDKKNKIGLRNQFFSFGEKNPDQTLVNIDIPGSKKNNAKYKEIKKYFLKLKNTEYGHNHRRLQKFEQDVDSKIKKLIKQYNEQSLLKNIGEDSNMYPQLDAKQINQLDNFIRKTLESLQQIYNFSEQYNKQADKETYPESLFY